jgi:ADP-ribosyl-[dinitrogen reductase] hydrolase
MPEWKWADCDGRLFSWFLQVPDCRRLLCCICLEHDMVNTKIRSKARGAIVGTAVGDAFGMPVEGLKPDTIAAKFGYLRSMVDPKAGTWAHRVHKLNRGQWTDDTQLMLAIGESIVAKGCLDFQDIAARHVLCLNDPRGWGKSTLTGIGRIKAGVAWWNAGAKDGAGNGPPMKIAPLGVLLALGKIGKFEARTAAINIARMTHGDPRPAIAGIIQMDAISEAMKYGSEGLYSAILSSHGTAESLEWSLDDRQDASHESLAIGLKTAVGMAESGKTLSEIREAVGAQSYVVESFPFTLAAVLKHRDDPEKCLIELAAQGGDADTTCAMAGALLGAAHGLSAFPERWRRPLEGYARLISLADGLSGVSMAGQARDFGERPRIRFSSSEASK